MSSTTASGTGRKRTIKDLQEEVSNLYNNIRLFEKGMKFFTGILTAIFSLIDSHNFSCTFIFNKTPLFFRWYPDCPYQALAKDSLYWCHQSHFQLLSFGFNDGSWWSCSHYKWSMLVIFLPLLMCFVFRSEHILFSHILNNFKR